VRPPSASSFPGRAATKARGFAPRFFIAHAYLDGAVAQSIDCGRSQLCVRKSEWF
jgi:hypothetical protein